MDKRKGQRMEKAEAIKFFERQISAAERHVILATVRGDQAAAVNLKRKINYYKLALEALEATKGEKDNG